MALKCLKCGHIFEEGEQVRWEERHGLDSPPYEKHCGCPVCKGSFEETKQCKICGGEFLEDELNGGCVCDECIDDYCKAFDICYKVSKNEKTEIEINCLLAMLLDVEKIEEILYQYLKAEKEVDCSSFINEDKDWFAEKLVKEMSK
jgi:reverse gyrase